MNPVLDKKQASSKKKFIKSKAKPNKPFSKINIQEVRVKPFRKSNLSGVKKQESIIPKLE